MKSKMSGGGPFITLGLTSLFCVSTIAYSHYVQVRDKEEMREGVRRDKQRQKLKRDMRIKAENDMIERQK